MLTTLRLAFGPPSRNVRRHVYMYSKQIIHCSALFESYLLSAKVFVIEYTYFNLNEPTYQMKWSIAKICNSIDAGALENSPQTQLEVECLYNILWTLRLSTRFNR